MLLRRHDERTGMGHYIRGIISVGVVVVIGLFVGTISQLQRIPEQESLVSPTINIPKNSKRIRVEVLNAGGESGMARLATDLLRDQGFDVVYFGNAPAFGKDSTVVLDRSGRLEAAQAVGDVLEANLILSEPDSNLYLDVTVLLGKEWKPKIQGIEDHPKKKIPWWRVKERFR